MSVSGSRSRQFLEPLEGKSAAFRLNDRQSNLNFARSVLGLLARERDGCRLLDFDAFYSSNLETVAAGIAAESLSRVEISIPEPGSEPEVVLAGFFRGGEAKPMIIDSVNTLYQLISSRNPRSASRKFSFFVSVLAAWSRSNGKPVIASIYDRRPSTRGRASRSLTDSFDVSVSVSAEENGLALKCERGSAWRGGDFFLPFEDGKVQAHEHRDGDQ